MSGAKHLMVDTNIVVLAISGNSSLQRHLNKFQITISIITEIELLSISFRNAEHEQLLRDFISGCVVMPISKEVKEQAARIRKVWKPKLPDAIIAASAMAANLQFLSADRGFNKIEEPTFKVSFYPD
jgi:predicted nucleic acid-binding protein